MKHQRYRFVDLPGSLKTEFITHAASLLLAFIVLAASAIVTKNIYIAGLSLFAIGAAVYYYALYIHPALSGDILVIDAVINEIKPPYAIKGRAIGREHLYILYNNTAVVVSPKKKNHGLSVGDMVQIFVRKKYIQQDFGEKYFLTDYYCMSKIIES